MNRRVLLLIIGSLLLPLGCGGNDDPTGPAYATLAVTTTSLPNAAPTVAYSETLVATGGDGTYTWSVTIGSLPTGLSLTTSTGLITGTPSAAGSNTFTVQVASGDGQTDTQQLTITVPPVLEPSELCSDYPDYAIATFEDAGLEGRIRSALLVGAQELLTCGLISGLTVLDARSVEITSLVGIQNLTSLSDLSLMYIPNLTDIGPLSGLPSLTFLRLTGNSISDIGPLSGLTGLWYLNLTGNSISDISALSRLRGVELLYLDANSITDISALSGLTSLWELGLSSNPDLSNIQPLLDNTGLGVGNYVGLQSTKVSCTDVTALRAKGVSVGSDCPY
jgi:Leucine-rich repeat (LRR) protein